MSETNARPPRDNLFRAVFARPELIRAEADDDGDGDGEPVMVGHFARTNEWTEIDSYWEGRFMERFATGAFKKTIRENRDAMRVLFQHGHDAMIGDKPLGPIRELKEDAEGAYYEVPLLDAPYVRNDLLPGLREGLYGASFRFRVMREEITEEPGRSDHNPEGLPERTVKEAEVREFGPVTFPAYAGATAGVRSITDDMLIQRMLEDPERLQAMLAAHAAKNGDETKSAAPDGGDERTDKPDPAAPVTEAPQQETATDPSAPGTTPTPLRSTVAPGTRPTPLRGMNPTTRKDRL